MLIQWYIKICYYNIFTYPLEITFRRKKNTLIYISINKFPYKIILFDHYSAVFYYNQYQRKYFTFAL